MFKIIFGALALFIINNTAMAQTPPASPYQEGVHYFAIEQAPGAKPGDSVEVTEVFSYLCTHCNTFEPYLQNWQSKMHEGVSLNRIPVEFGRAAWSLYARAYVAASVMGIAEKSHVPMMDAIWKQRRQMHNMEQLAEFYSDFGVNKETFLATAQSFAVDAQLRREQQLARTYGVTGTPTLIVNGRYRVAAGGAVPSLDMMLSIVDYLVAQELALQAAQQAQAQEGEAEVAASGE